MISLIYFLGFSFLILDGEASNKCPAVCNCIDHQSSWMELDCSGHGLLGLPKLQLINVTSLDISYNNISYIHDYEFFHWGYNVKFLHLSRNYIRRIDKGVFWPLTNLMSIYLDYNYISSIHPLAFQRNPTLCKLILNGNPLKLPEYSEFLQIPSLGWLSMENCNLSYIPDIALKHLKNLVVLRLSNNRIKHLDPLTFSELHNLIHIHLEGNEIVHLDPFVFRNNTNLQWLYLGKNPLGTISSKVFMTLDRLLSLDLSHCNINLISTKLFSNLQNLKSLNLNNNRLKSFEISNIPINLEVLDLSGNGMESIYLVNKSEIYLPKLKFMDISGNNLTCDCRFKELYKLCLRMNEKFERMCGPESCEFSEILDCDANTWQMGSSRKMQLEESKNISGVNVNNSVTDDIENSTSIYTKKTIYEPDYDIGFNPNKVNEDELLNNETSPAVVPKGTEAIDTHKMWNIILYTCIGFLALLCVLGAAVLVVEMCLGCGRTQRRSFGSNNSSLRHVRLQLMKEEEEPRPPRPLSFHQGFDFVSVPTSNSNSFERVPPRIDLVPVLPNRSNVFERGPPPRNLRRSSWKR
ncbi:hypothetical protein C0J52_15985 [Blattella germanica]|nr:hypothetical protein C0J52_15985 [Blattella germanica]